MTLGCGARSHCLRRPLAILLTLIFVAALALQSVQASAARSSSDPPLDLAAMALTPGDLAAVGQDGYGVAGGRTLPPDSVAAVFSFERGVSEDSARELFAGAGLIQTYELRLDLIDQGDLAGSARSTVQEYGDVDGADAAFTALADWSGVLTAESVDGEMGIADAASLTRLHGPTAAPFLALDLTVRSGRIVASVRLVDLHGDEPAPEDVEGLARRLVERIDAQVHRQGDGLGQQTLQITGNGVSSIWDYYTFADGELRSRAGASPDETSEDEDAMTTAGIVAEYEVSQRIAIDGTSDRGAFFYGIVQRFEDAEAASDYLHGAPDRLAESDQFDEFSPIHGLRQFGEESAAYSQRYHWAAKDIDLIYQTYILRVGEQLGLVQLIAPDGVPIAALEELAATQAACLEAGKCDGTAPLPEELEEMVWQAGDRRIDRLSGRVRGPALTSTTYSGPTFGVQLAYDPDSWSVLTETSGEDGDSVSLFERGTTSLVSLSAYHTDHGADACIAELTSGFADDEAFGAAKPVTDEFGNPIGESQPNRGFAAYGFAVDDGAPTFVYLECRTFAGGDSMLLITQVGPLAEYEARTTSREALLEDLILPT